MGGWGLCGRLRQKSKHLMFAQWIFEKGKFIVSRERKREKVEFYQFPNIILFIWMVMMIQWSLFCDNLCLSFQVSAWFMDKIHPFCSYFWWWDITTAVSAALFVMLLIVHQKFKLSLSFAEKKKKKKSPHKFLISNLDR